LAQPQLGSLWQSQGHGQQTCTGTSLQTTFGTQHVTVYGTCFGTQ
jgi:hypothetical protein